jgi:competence protein ComEA
MPAIPTRRLLVYVAAGLVVLIVGTVGLLSMARNPAGSADGVVIEAGDAALGGIVTGDGVGAYGLSGLADGTSTPAASASTSTTEAPRIWVQVAGAVRRPGVYQMSATARAFEAVLEAGGFADDADQEAVALAALLSDGCRVYVPRVGEAVAGQIQTPAESSAGITPSGPGGAPGSGGASSEPISLNSATLEQLDTLPGIGPSLAQQILSYREAHGPFTSVDQLTEVPGIGPAKLEQLRPLVRL